MSARPRPVTATFRAEPLDYGLTPRTYSLSSGGSTESLVSVLDHDSYDDLRFSDSEHEQEKEAKKKLASAEQNKLKVKRARPRKPKVSASHEDINNITFIRLEADNEKQTEDGGDGDTINLSCWETWLLEKAKEDRKRLKREARLKRRAKEEQLKQKEIEEQKKKKGEEKYREWLVQSNQKTKRANVQKHREEKVTEELGQAKQDEIERKSKEKFEEWLKEKKEKEKQNRLKEKERKQQEEEKKKEYKKQCDAAYENWKKEAQNRPRSAHHSFGYTAGKLTGYYDNNATPVPTFYNPIPWQPIEVPKPKPTKKKLRPNTAKFNPNKYL